MTTSPATLEKDPVCGMTVDPATAKARAEHAGQTYYFCCAGCAQKFQSNPDEYLKPKSPKPTLVTLGGLATTQPKPTTEKTSASGSGQSDQKSAAAYVCPM